MRLTTFWVFSTDYLSFSSLNGHIISNFCLVFENMRPSRRQELRSHSKRKLADDKLEEKEASARDVRRYCTGCYEKMRQQQ
jgi:hypothetical protein